MSLCLIKNVMLLLCYLFKFKGVNVQLRKDASFFVYVTDINQTINHFFSCQPLPSKRNIDDGDGDDDGDDDDDDDDDDDSGLRDEYLNNAQVDPQ